MGDWECSRRDGMGMGKGKYKSLKIQESPGGGHALSSCVAMYVRREKCVP